MGGLWIVLVGNPAEGYAAYGPYSSPDEAHCAHKGEFTLLRLQSKAAEDAEAKWRGL